MDRVKRALLGKSKKSITRRIARAIRKRFPKKDDPSIIEGLDNPNYNPYHRGKGRKRRKTKRVPRKRLTRKKK
jgi:NAD(P)H-dependent FMN reductase